MSITVTAADVAAIIEVDPAITLTPFIEVSVGLVTKCCTDLDDDYADSWLNKIATWLAAHFYTVRDMRAESEKAGPVSEKFQSKVDLGFSTSHYGQMAMRLDYYGGLARLDEAIKKGKSNNIGVTFVGITKDEYSDYND